MKSQFKLASVLGFASASLSAHAVFITQNVDNTTITSGNSVSCNSGNIHTDNWYARGFQLSDYGIFTPFQVSSVRFGVELAGSGSGTQSITVNVYDGYTVSGAVITPGALAGTSTFNLADGALFFHIENVNALITSGRVLAEIFTPDGFAAGNSFFIGSNPNGQTGPSYIKAPDCGVTSLTNLGAIGFPNMHSLIALNGEPVPEPATLAVLGLGALAVMRRRRKA